MNPNELLTFDPSIKLPNNEGFSLEGYDAEGRSYLRESYWQMTSLDMKIDLEGNILDKKFYDPQGGEEAQGDVGLGVLEARVNKKKSRNR